MSYQNQEVAPDAVKGSMSLKVLWVWLSPVKEQQYLKGRRGREEVKFLCHRVS